MGGEMITLTRTDDLALVTTIMQMCARDIGDDTTPRDAQASDGQTHLLVTGPGTCGVISVNQAWGGAWNIHVTFPAGARRHVKEGLHEALKWIRENTPATCLIGIAESGKPGIAATCRVLGMRPIGVLERAYLRGSGVDATIWQRAL
jgi:hypothetical protein